METQPGRHRPVLVQETLGFLRNGPGLYLDATLGEGGHARALCVEKSTPYPADLPDEKVEPRYSLRPVAVLASRQSGSE